MENFEPKIKRIENEEYKTYPDRIQELVIDKMQELGILSQTKKRKIRRHKQLPAEAVFIFKKLEEKGIDVAGLPDEKVKGIIDYAFSLIDRKNEYDKDLMKKIGQMETMRWRQGENLADPESFTKIVQTLKEHAVPNRPKTLMEQQPVARLQPRGEYHKKQNLS